MGFIEIRFAARYLGVSTRRIRALLAQGRLAGYKDERNIWMVDSSLIVRPGSRGPLPRKFASSGRASRKAKK
jgi:hypothetical protein